MFKPYIPFELSIIPGEGYKVHHVLCNGEDIIENIINNKLSFDDPDSDINLNVVFCEKYTAGYTLTTEDNDLYSLYLDYNYTIPEGITAYTGKLNEDETTLNLTKVEGCVIPAGCGVLVKSNAVGDFTFNKTTETAELTSDLKGVTEDTEVTSLAKTGQIVLTLGVKDNILGFRKPAGSKIKANKAYLLVNATTSTAKGVKISFDDETTDINNINATKTDSYVPIYNLTGQRVANGTKGLLIKNGKKIINK